MNDCFVENGFVRGTPAKCLNCGKTIFKIAEIHRFCSKECRDTFYENNPKPNFAKLDRTARLKKCKKCGKIFEVPENIYLQKFCPDCKKNIAELKSQPRQNICKYCGKPFITAKNHSGQKFCSPKCRNDFHDNGVEPLPEERKIKICKFCGKAFTPQKSSDYCSAACASKDYYRKNKKPYETLICPVCGKQFTQSDRRQIYCSRKCANCAAHIRRSLKYAKSH